MNRSSSRKDLRAERRGVTPYTRTPLKQSTSWNPLASLKSFAQSFVGRSGDDISISGSEEEWDGKVPEVMHGEDIFSLAAAAGRGGADFEERAKTWREGKASLRAKPPAKSDWGALGLSDADSKLRSYPSMPALREIEGPKHLAIAPPPRDLRPSGSTLALRRFMEDKGVRFEPRDADVLEGLARSLRTEPAESRPLQLGGWSAGTPIKAKSPVKALDVPSTPGSVFSLGTNAPLPPRSAAQRKITYLGPGMSQRRLNRDPKPARKPILNNLEYAKKRKVDDAIEVEPVAATPEVAAAASIAAAFNAKRKAAALPVRPPPVQAPRAPSPKKRGDDVLRDLIDETLGPETSSKPSIVINPYEDLAPAPNGKVPALRSSLRQSSASHRISMRGSASRGAAEKLVNLGNSTRKMSTLEMVAGYTSSRDTPASASPEPVISKPGNGLKASTFTAPVSKAAPEVVSKAPETVAFKPLPVPSLSSSTSSKPTPKPVQEDKPMPSAIDEITSSKPAPAPVFNPPSFGLGPPPAVIPPRQQPTRSTSTRRFDSSAIYLSAKDSALNVDKAALPFFTFTLPSGSPEPSEAVKEAARKRPIQSFNFTMRSPSISAPFLPPAEKAAEKTPASQKAAQWTCDLCMLSNPDSAKEQCTVCEAPRPGAAPAKAAPPAAMPAPPTSGFSFGKPSAPSSSGFTMPKPAAAPAGQWKCSTCDLQNPSTATEKCTICEAPKPGAAPAAPKAPAAMPAPPSGGFAFGKPATPQPSVFAIPKPATPAGQWKCDTCDLQNPSTATEKCTICETPKPGAAPAAAAPPAALPTPPAGGFSFGAKPAAPSASGFSFGAKPAPAGQWKCDTCDLQNPSTATEKCTICETPKPGAKPAASGFTVSGPPAPPSGGFTFGGAKAGPPAPPSGGFSFGGKPVVASAPSSAPAPALPGLPAPPSGGFTFGASAPAVAPLLKPTGGAGEWTCSTCGLSNPASATEKCTICEEPKK